MVESTQPRISTGATLRDGFASLLRAPFRGLLLLALLITLVLDTLPVESDDATVLATLVLFALSLYLQIATTLAAAEAEASHSVDLWLKQAVRRRCFWRFLGAAILVVLTVVASGLVGVVVGAFLMGGIVALADPAVVLEHKGPVEAIARSAELGKGSRRPLIVLFGLLILVPGMSLQVGSFFWDVRSFFGDLWPVVSAVVVILGFAGSIALTRAFLELGGSVLPRKERLSA
ncbi:MAG TPA: hypothetical protein VJ927_07470 [Actinomycetota bacterium]|nr:hypothetical protein [Actinomycetota bacterium]